METEKERTNTEHITISVAARALGVSRKHVYSLIQRGQLTRIDEGGRGYIPADQVRALRERLRLQTESKNMRPDTNQPETETVTVNREHYDGLLVRLGQLEAREQLLIEHKATVERQGEELQVARIRIAELETQLATRRPWWKRFFGGRK